MSTRANVKLVDHDDELWFYRHSDGYPEGTLPTLNIFMDWLKAGKIRANRSQAGGWLVIIGAIECGTIPKHEAKQIKTIEPPQDWKVGSYEPTTGQHGDIEFLYTIDLVSQTLEIKEIL